MLKLPLNRVHMYRHTDKRSKAHKQWSPYGLAILEFHSSKFKQWFDRAMAAYASYLLMESQSKEIPWTTWRRHGDFLADGSLGDLHGLLTDDTLDRFNLAWTMPNN